MSEVLVLGATGNVGSALTRRLAEARVPVRAFFDPSTSQAAAFPSGVAELHGSFDDEAALRRSMEGVDAVFLLTPPHASQIRWQQAVVDAAVDRGVRRIVKLSAFDSGSDSPLQMGRWHHHGEVAVAASGCDYVILRPQYFMQTLVGPMAEAAKTGVLTMAAEGSTRLGLVDVEDIAAVAAVVLTRPGHEGEVLVPTGPAALSFDEMAATLADVLGREVRYEQRDAGELTRWLAERGMPDWHIDDVLKIHGEAASAAVTSDVEEITGTAPRSFAAFVRERFGQLAVQ